MVLTTGTTLYYKRRKLKKEDKKLADKIRKLRKEAGMTQEELAAKLGVNFSYIAYIETHRRGLSLPMLYKIAKIFKVKPSDLLNS